MAAPAGSPQAAHILVAGPSKTGTTGVYASVKRGLKLAGIDARTVHEPVTPDTLDTLFRFAPTVPVMTKVTMNRIKTVVPDVRVFDRRVMTVRDPRDVVVSSLLFRPLTTKGIHRTAGTTAVSEFVAALERKEADPSSLSVLALFELARDLRIGSPPFPMMVTVMSRQKRFMDRGLVHLVRYERFVENDLDDLSEYLGFAVENTSARQAAWIGHVARSQSSGDFRRWFLPDDLTFFNDLFGEHLRAFGYERDVTLDPEPKIDPATSSEYVRVRHADRCRQLAERTDADWSPEHVQSREELGRLIELAEDGYAFACVRVAEVYLSGHVGGPDVGAALTWARYAAQLGSVRGMQMTHELLTRLPRRSAAQHREGRVWALELRERTGREAVRDRRASRLEQKVQRLTSSRRYRIGSYLAGDVPVLMKLRGRIRSARATPRSSRPGAAGTPQSTAPLRTSDGDGGGAAVRTKTSRTSGR
ncbi:MAG: hypothetical protein ACRDYU_08495 [Actinomycetes bacterium]